MNKTKEKDFVEIDYRARIKETNELFDVTYADEAKKLNSKTNHSHYGPKIICLGQGQIFLTIEKELIGKEIGSVHIIELKPEQAFKNKDPSLMKTINTQILKDQKINPFPGLQINASGMIGTIRTVNGGRTIIDFNHPLAGRNVVYEVKINKIVTDNKEKIGSLLQNLLGIHDHDYEIKIDNNKAEIKSEIKLSKEYIDSFIKKVKEIIPELTEIVLQ